MAREQVKWDVSDLSRAMATAIAQHAHDRFLRQSGETIKFNGFWREGDKQNICAWLDKATWHDAKTGEGGGCKEFAKVAFNMNLPEFMARFGALKPILQQRIVPVTPKSANALAVDYVDKIWKELCSRDLKRNDYAGNWLEKERGITDPRFFICSGFANLYEEDIDLFDKSHQALLQQRLSLGPNLISPIRGVDSSKVQNLFFRAINPVVKDQKSRLLTGAGGFGNVGSNLRSFGFPNLIHDFPNLVLCEGMADYFAAEFLLDAEEKFLPIGASNADALTKWALYLTQTNYKGAVTIIFHIDTDNNDDVSAKETGPAKAISAAKILKEHHIRVQIFPWLHYLKNTTTKPHKVQDLADSLRQELIDRECSSEHLQEMFRLFLNREGDL